MRPLSQTVNKKKYLQFKFKSCNIVPKLSLIWELCMPFQWSKSTLFAQGNDEVLGERPKSNFQKHCMFWKVSIKYCTIWHFRVKLIYQSLRCIVHVCGWVMNNLKTKRTKLNNICYRSLLNKDYSSTNAPVKFIQQVFYSSHFGSGLVKQFCGPVHTFSYK